VTKLDCNRVDRGDNDISMKNNLQL
jgi:hypothetical protein